MEYQNIIVEQRDHITSITLNRPQVLNAMNDALIAELEEALEQFDRDDDAWIAILSGNGRCFSAGADVRQFNSLTREERATRGLLTRKRSTWLADLKQAKPVIAAVHGYVYGIAIILATECDIIIAAEDAQFSIRELKRGLGGGSIWARVFFWMPSKLATEMALTGDPISAQDAWRLGLVNQVVPAKEDLLPAAQRLAERILANPPLAVRSSVRVSRLGVEALLRDARLSTLGQQLQLTEDFEEASRAFVEKRAPVWKGR